MGCSASKFVQEVTDLPLKGAIPDALDVKFAKSMTKVLINLTNPQKGTHWLAWLPYGFTGPIIFYDGPTNTDPVMMVVNHENKRGTKFGVRLPGYLKEKRTQESETLTWSCGFVKSELYWFEFEVSPGRTERFEWRRSRGKEVESLDMAKWGWKLVMESHGARKNSSEKQSRKLREEGFASDGGEVVAVWGASYGLSKLGHFELRDRGLELGDSFALMALATSLTVECNTIAVAQLAAV